MVKRGVVTPSWRRGTRRLPIVTLDQRRCILGKALFFVAMGLRIREGDVLTPTLEGGRGGAP